MKKYNENKWQDAINVRDFIQNNYTPYSGDEAFLSKVTGKTKELWTIVENMVNKEIADESVTIDNTIFSGINNYEAGYIKKDSECIVGLQTDQPLKRTVNPYGGMRMVETSLESYGLEMEAGLIEEFKGLRKTHNEGVFDAYTTDMKIARSVGLLTGLPDAYGRGRIIGDYRRIALYGMDYLMKEKKKERLDFEKETAVEQVIQLREEANMQLRAMAEIKKNGCQIWL